MITSASNPHVKQMRSLGRRRVRQAERAFLVEGRRLVEEAARHGSVRSLLVAEDVPQAWVEATDIPPERVRRVRSDILAEASDVEHGQGVAAICELPDVDISDQDMAPGTPLVLILDRLRDPGNLGTALRSAAAAGVRVVLTTHGTVDPYAPKVVRAGMGAHFRLKIGNLTRDRAVGLQASGRAIVHADASAPAVYSDFPWRRAIALVVGGETEALSPDLEALVTDRVAIPMASGMESLNAGVAASVLLFEVQRQAREPAPAVPGVDI